MPDRPKTVCPATQTDTLLWSRTSWTTSGATPFIAPSGPVAVGLDIELPVGSETQGIVSWLGQHCPHPVDASGMLPCPDRPFNGVRSVLSWAAPSPADRPAAHSKPSFAESGNRLDRAVRERSDQAPRSQAHVNFDRVNANAIAEVHTIHDAPATCPTMVCRTSPRQR